MFLKPRLKIGYKMELKKIEFPQIDLTNILYSILIFLLMFGVGYLAYPDEKYSSNIDITADAENPEQLIEFDNRNVTLNYNQSEGNYLVVEGREEELQIENRQNDIFAVDGKVYMFYFHAEEDFIRLIRIEQL